MSCIRGCVNGCAPRLGRRGRCDGHQTPIVSQPFCFRTFGLPGRFSLLISEPGLIHLFFPLRARAISFAFCPLSGRKELHKSVLASPLVVAEQPPKVLGKAAPRKRNIQEQEQNNYFVRALKTNTKWNVQEQERNNDFVRALKANTKWNVQKQMQNNYFVFAFNTSTK